MAQHAMTRGELMNNLSRANLLRLKKNQQLIQRMIDALLKLDLMEMPVKFFETLTFGELRVGQKFISLPLAGDNIGHGGLKGTHYIFTKTSSGIDETSPCFSYYDIPHGLAVNNRGVPGDFPYSTPVILVE